MTLEGWAIADSDGLFYGVSTTRSCAIAAHVHDFDADCFKAGWKNPALQFGRKLNQQQVSAWNRLKKRGHRAVRVTVSVNKQ